MTPEAEQPVDRECIEKLMSLMGAAYPRLVQSFLQNTEAYIDAIGAALREGKRDVAVATAHKMKSSSGQFGLAQLQSLAKQIEYCESPDNAVLLDLHLRLKPAFVRAAGFMREHHLDGA